MSRNQRIATAVVVLFGGGLVVAVAGVWGAERYLARTLEAQLRESVRDAGMEEFLSWEGLDVSLWRRGGALTEVVVRDEQALQTVRVERVGCDDFWQRQGVVVSLSCEAQEMRVRADALAAIGGVRLPALQDEAVFDVDMAWSLDRGGRFTAASGVTARGMGAVTTRLSLDNATPELLAHLAGEERWDPAAIGELAPDLKLRELAIEVSDRGGVSTVRASLAEILGVAPAEIPSVVEAKAAEGVASLGLYGVETAGVGRWLSDGGTLRLGTNLSEPTPLFVRRSFGIQPVLMDPLQAIGWVKGLGLGAEHHP